MTIINSLFSMNIQAFSDVSKSSSININNSGSSLPFMKQTNNIISQTDYFKYEKINDGNRPAVV
ncbi:hypothetical protein DICPUDRAFT_152034 [Dictyostelium purpureum]|uniref:Uncharacterized protein n=1 Tax=Dictyostelium purpureum TaxID=5786 RepID=F0ZKB0_DICPU|nr:uncharacterized protein DICPUDRAFT_152034 [Dictyostelium purpureum]EGC35612.1 hypothetical protein DICPUDRAFT_152034 [Dictyostelium purpureum]|eukprot:XP_003287849.1 hypothetical protein DICPUDRAFT_152034 [Dictyostelium purpureum]